MQDTTTTGLKLRDYQTFAVDYLRGRRRAGLFLTAQEGGDQ